VSLFDSANLLIETRTFDDVRPDDGVLEWHGWSSTIPIKRLTYTEDFVVVDGLQANVVPEPSSLILLATGSLLLLHRRSALR